MISRRNFMLEGAAGIAAAGLSGCVGKTCATRRIVAPGAKVRLAAVGVWGKGFSDWLPMVLSGKAELVAICDVDKAALEKAAAELKKQQKAIDLAKVPFFTDYRAMIDDADKLGIDAMTVSTPDHMHAPIAVTAMRQGISCYVQKPLVRTLEDLRVFAETARASGVVTQMGHQGSSGASLRRAVEILQSGLLGDIREIHVWTNRPVWPQGNRAVTILKNTPDALPPASLDWEAWLGVAAKRPFKGDRGNDPRDYAWCTKNGLTGVYHPFNWRGFTDFGTGALGDMACHLMNLPFRGAELGKFEGAKCAALEGAFKGVYPDKSIVELTFAARESKVRHGVKLPAVKMYWYEGGLFPPADITEPIRAVFKKVPIGGCVVLGEKGSLYSTDNYGQNSFVKMAGDAKMKSIHKHEACKAISERIPRRAEKGTLGNYIEFLDAVRGVGPIFDETHSRCYGDIEHSVPLVESMLKACAVQGA